MRAKSLIFLSLIVAICFASTPFAFAAAVSTPASFLHLRLEGPSDTVTAAALRLRVSLENTGAGCHPIYVDPLFSPFEIPHRGSRLAIYVYDDQGNKLTAQSGYPPNVVRLTPDRLLLLDCGAFYGSFVELGRPSMWSMTLKPGQYRARAELEVTTRTVAEEEHGFVDVLAKRDGSTAAAKQLLVNSVLWSNEISFGIIAPPEK